MDKKKQIDWRVILGGMGCLTIAELYNLHLGNNGTYFAIFVGIIAGTIGFTLPQPKI